MLARQRFSFSEYAKLEEMSPTKHEFLDGAVWAMAGGSPEHAAIAANLSSWFHRQLEGRPCRVFSSDLRIRVRETGLGTYPDVSIVSDQLETDPEDPKGHTVNNPRLVVEVLSPSTADYDRGEKLAHFKRIETLREILLVDPEQRSATLWSQGGQWRERHYTCGEAVTLELTDQPLPVDEIFRDPLET